MSGGFKSAKPLFMRLLLTADIHRDEAKLRWILESAPAHDALLVAGDLLDIFSSASFVEQKSKIVRWKSGILARERALAWCSGNHDFFDAEHTPMAAASPRWMREAPSTKTFVADGESRLIETAGGRLAVTTIPWPVHGGQVVIDGYRTDFFGFATSLLRKGKLLQTEECVPWIVLCHEPPDNSPLVGDYVAAEAVFTRRLIESAEPDFSLHGHVHEAPDSFDGSWIWRRGFSAHFNAGQSGAGEDPNYIILDLNGRDGWSATWSGFGKIERAKSSGADASIA